jgi:hypothetical protein
MSSTKIAYHRYLVKYLSRRETLLQGSTSEAISAKKELACSSALQADIRSQCRLPFSFEVPCDYWGRSAIIDPDGRDDERMFGLWYTLDLHVTRRIKDNQTETIVVQFPTKKTIQDMMRDVPGWRKIYHGRFFSLVSSPVDPGETVPPLEYVSYLSFLTWLTMSASRRTIEEFAPQLGPINLIITSRSFSIGAL